MKHTNYDIMVAINLRANGTGDLLLDTMGNPKPVDFRTSIDAARNQVFLYGYYYPGEDMLIAMSYRPTGITRDHWKEINHSYRYWMWFCSLDHTESSVCPKCGGTLRMEQNYHVINLVCNNCENDIQVMPIIK